MSLINDALKKAQRDRSGDSPATPPAGPTPPGAPPPAATATAAASSSGFKAWPIVAIVALAVVGVLGWRILATSSEKPAEVAATESPKPVESAPAAPAQSETKPEQAAPTPNEAAPTPTDDKPVEVAKPAPTTESSVAQNPPVQSSEPPPMVAVKVEPTKTEPQQPVVTVSIPAATAAPPAQPPATNTARELPATSITIPEGPASTSSTPMISLRQQDPRILAYLDALVVNGIRPSPDDPKVLMNNRVYRVRDVVDRELNLKLTSIAPQRLTFEDERGMEYVKSF